MTNLIERARKIQELIKRGATDGEKQAAIDALERLLKEHGLSLDDIITQTRKSCKFTVQAKWQETLLLHVVATVKGTTSESVGRRGKNRYYDLTELEYQECASMFTFYKKAFIDDLDNLMLAFLSKHELLAPANETSEVDWGVIQRWRQIVQMRKTLASQTYKPLGTGDQRQLPSKASS